MVCVWCIGCDGERKFTTFLSPICVVHGCNVLNKRDDSIWMVALSHESDIMQCI